MQELPFFFPNDDYNLFGVFHSPDTGQIDECIVLCHAFGEEKLWSHRVSVNFARAAARRNIAVLRFDFMGHGDSDGQSEQATIGTYFSDIDAALSEARRLCPNARSVGLLGTRFGGTLATLYAAERQFEGPIVLWEPVINGAKYMQELLRINLGTQLATLGSVQKNRKQLVEEMKAGADANVDGYLISNVFHEECCEIDLLSADLFVSHCRILVVHIAQKLNQLKQAEFVQLADSSMRGEFLSIGYPTFWREIRPFCSIADELNNQTLDRWT